MHAPISRKLEEARKQLAGLIHSSARESEFQALFARCPYVLSRSLPLRLRPTDFYPLGRPGHSDPDFIFYPRSSEPLWSFGVIELKRPNTTLFTIPRKDVAILSRDAQTAISQAQQYCKILRKDLLPKLTSNLIVGAADYVFVIAGLTDEFSRKLTPGMLYETLADVLPPRCNIIPYDELLRRFESSLPPRTLYFTPFADPASDLENLVALAKQAFRIRRGITDENMNFWSVLEDRWRAGGYMGTAIPRVIDRSYWCISGTNELATESPAHIMFPSTVEYLVDCIRSSGRLHKLLNRAQSKGCDLEEVKKLLTPGAVQKLSSAIQRCKKSHKRFTWMESFDPDVELLQRLGLVRFTTVESGDFHYELDPLLRKLWQVSN